MYSRGRVDLLIGLSVFTSRLCPCDLTVRWLLSRYASTMRAASFLKRFKKEDLIDESHFFAQVKSCQIGLLWYLYEQYLSAKNDGVFVEVGGYDGLFVSNSWGLAEAGWTGYLIEPNPQMAEKCREAHSLNKNVSVTEVAIGPVGVKTIDLHLAGTLSTANPILFD